MTDFVRPVDAVAAALSSGGGSTLADIAAATSYPPAKVVELIQRLRTEGTSVRAIAGEREPDGSWSPTVYAIVRDPR